MTNKLALTIKHKKHTRKETNPKPTGHSLPVRTAHMSVHITGYNCGTQCSTEQGRVQREARQKCLA